MQLQKKYKLTRQIDDDDSSSNSTPNYDNDVNHGFAWSRLLSSKVRLVVRHNTPTDELFHRIILRIIIIIVTTTLCFGVPTRSSTHQQKNSRSNSTSTYIYTAIIRSSSLPSSLSAATAGTIPAVVDDPECGGW